MVLILVLGTVRSTVHPTENVEKVESAIRNILGDIPLQRAERWGGLVVEGKIETLESLRPLRDLLRRLRIRDTFYSVLTRAASEDHLSFGLNKQAAYAGKASLHLSRESPLGPIHIELNGDIETAIKYLCK
jgi:predicted RNA binding protein with dsRBD fold (UPF0201 family)